MCLRKWCGVAQIWWLLELWNLCHCVQHPWKPTSRDFWSSRNTRKPFSKQKCVFEKMVWGISETVNARAFNLCHCDQHPRKLSSRDFWSSRNTRKQIFSAKMCLEEMVWGISETVNARTFKTFVIVFSTPEKLLVGITGALGMKESHFLSKNVFWGNVVGSSDMVTA